MKTKFLLRAFTLSGFYLAAAGALKAQATRTWVSGVGDDVNPCSRTAPCKTFAGAISKTAAGGEIDALDPGGFGTVTITKAITIDGGGSLASILASGTNGVNVIAGAGDVVVLRNLSINGAPPSVAGLIGVNATACKALHIENCRIMTFRAGTGVGINFAPRANSNLFVRNTIIADCSVGGILVKPSAVYAGVMLEQVSLVNNGYGVHAEDGGHVKAFRCVATNNTGSGFEAISGGGPLYAFMILEGCSSSFNGGAGVSAAGAFGPAVISNSTFDGNGKGLDATFAATITSIGGNKIIYNGVDGNPNTTLPAK